MKLSEFAGKLPNPVRRHPVLAVLLLLAAIALALLPFRSNSRNLVATAYHEVRRGDLTISVVEGGALSAVSEVVVRNEVDGTARIVWIVPEGSYVKKGDLLVELDAAQAEDQLNMQRINFEKAKFAVEQARTQLEITRSATNSDFLAADLKLRFAKIDRQKYQQGQRMVDLVEASNRVIQAEAQLAVNIEAYTHSTNLAAKGYETRQRVDGDRLAVLNLRNSLIVATNSLWMLQQFDVQKSVEKYDSDVEQAEQELERVVYQNRRKMAQLEAELLTQINTLELSQEKLERDQKNLEATKIYAPQEGLVVYQVSENRWSSESLVEGGAVVRNRQELIKLPDLSRMKVTVKVHESTVTMIRAGLPAFVTLDSMPELRFRGVVERVAPLPDTQSRWGNPNLKVYNTDVYLTDPIPNVKPGVSAKAEIIVTNVPNALSVPIQAITTLKGKQVAYLLNSGKPEPSTVEIGLFNTRFIEITSGLKEGDRVMLAPPFDTQTKDIAGSLLTPEEKLQAATNLPPRTPNGSPGGPVPGPGSAPLAANLGGEGLGQGRGPEGTNTGRPRMSTEDFIKRFDKDGDGQLSEAERAAAREATGGGRGSGGPRPGGEGRPRRSQEGGSGPGQRTSASGGI